MGAFQTLTKAGAEDVQDSTSCFRAWAVMHFLMLLPVSRGGESESGHNEVYTHGARGGKLRRASWNSFMKGAIGDTM